MGETKTAAIIGLGYVGLLLKKKGYRAIGVDTNAERVEQIVKGIAPFKDDETAKDLALADLPPSTIVEKHDFLSPSFPV